MVMKLTMGRLSWYDRGMVPECDGDYSFYLSNHEWGKASPYKLSIF